MRFLNILRAISGFLLLACCASPLVKYEKVEAEDRQGKSKFQLAESVITFEYGKTKSGDTDIGVINITSVPVPHDGLYAVSGTGYLENWGVDTRINVTYRSDTTLIQEIGVSVTDRREELLEAASKAVVGIIGMGLDSTPNRPPRLPDGIPVMALLKNDHQYQCRGLNGNEFNPDDRVICDFKVKDSPFEVQIDITAISKDVVSVDELENKFTSRSFFYAACRPASVTLSLSTKDEEGQTQRYDLSSKTVAISDPRWLQTLRFPDKGKVSVQPSCGANATAEDAKLPTGLDYVNALIGAANSIKDATEKKK